MSKKTKAILVILGTVIIALLIFVGLLFKVYKNFSGKRVSLKAGKQKIEISNNGESISASNEDNEKPTVDIKGKEVSASLPEVKALDNLVGPVLESVFGRVKLTNTGQVNGAQMGITKNINVLEYTLSKKTTLEDINILKSKFQKKGFKVFASSIETNSFIMMLGKGMQPNIAVNGNLGEKKIDVEGWVVK